MKKSSKLTLQIIAGLICATIVLSAIVLFSNYLAAKKAKEAPHNSIANGHTHFFSDWVGYDQSKHARSCDCGFTLYENHNIESIESEDGTSSAVCSLCSYVAIEAHMTKAEEPKAGETGLLDIAFLPGEICCAVGTNIEIYNRNVCVNADNYKLVWECKTGEATDSGYRITGADSIIGEYPLSLTVKDKSTGKTVWSSVSTIKIVPAYKGESSICFIGDSLSNAKNWEAELINKNNNFSLVGTMKAASYDINDKMRGFSFEGRSGWSAAKYLTAGDSENEPEKFKYINPFYNPDSQTFDWAYYVKNSLAGVSPDAVQVFLGTNGAQTDPTENANNIRTIIDSIRSADKNIPVYFVNTIYMSDNSDDINDVKIFNLMVKTTEIFKDYDNLYFVPAAICHDSENNFTETDLIHPTKAGYMQIADIIYSTISAHQTK